jgi:hypothetical protein
MSETVIDYKSILKPDVQYRLYNPNPKAVEGQHNGRIYRIPGRDEHYVDSRGQRFSEPGVFPVYPYNYTIRLGERTTEDKVMTAEMIVVHLVGEDGISGQIGGAGVRLLPSGDETLAEAVKRDALEASRTKAYADAGATIAAFEAENAKRIEYKQTPIQPPPKVKEAYRYRAEVERVSTADLPAFQCPKCYEGIADETKLRAHIAEIHSAYEATLLKAAGLEMATPDDDDVPVAPVKRGPGRPRKAEAAA